jgi:NhaP-type Na+/H+ or K+/H+ antiporter
VPNHAVRKILFQGPACSRNGGTGEQFLSRMDQLYLLVIGAVGGLIIGFALGYGIRARMSLVRRRRARGF